MKELEIQRNEIDNEYLKQTILENVTFGILCTDTIETLELESEDFLEDAMEDFVSQIQYINTLTTRAYMQQLPEVVQDQLMEAKSYLNQVECRYEYLSQGRIYEPEDLLGDVNDINWEETRKVALIGLSKYILTIYLLFNEASKEKEIMDSLTEEQKDKVLAFMDSAEGVKHIFEKEEYLNASFTEMFSVEYTAEEDEDSEDGDTTGEVSYTMSIKAFE